MELSLIVVLAVVGLLQVAAGVLFIRTRRAVDRLDGRVGHLATGLSLLTETTESGLRDVASEIGRLGAAHAPRPRPRAVTARRIASAARRGRSVAEIAAAEQLSEGEVNLRLQLADVGPRRRKTADAAAV